MHQIQMRLAGIQIDLPTCYRNKSYSIFHEMTGDIFKAVL